MLHELYQIYFQHEIRGNYDFVQLRKMSEKVVFEFLKEFDICPSLITKSVAYKVFLASVNSQQQAYFQTGVDIIVMAHCDFIDKMAGRVFTFMHFLDMIVRYALVAYSVKTESGGLILAEALCMLLERMELSKGFVNFEKRSHRPHTSKQTLLPSKMTLA